MAKEGFLHRFIKCFAEKGTLKSSHSNPSAIGKALEAPSNLALNFSRDGAPRSSLENLYQCLSILTVKNYFQIPNLNLSSDSLKASNYLCGLLWIYSKRSKCPYFGGSRVGCSTPGGVSPEQRDRITSLDLLTIAAAQDTIGFC